MVHEPSKDASVWNEFSEQFEHLAAEERDAKTPPLRACVCDSKYLVNVAEWSFQDQGWDRIRETFKVRSAEAARSFGAVPADSELVSVWLHRVYQYLCTSHSDKKKPSIGSTYDADGKHLPIELPGIEKVCAASAAFCRSVQHTAIESDHTNKTLPERFREWIEENSSSHEPLYWSSGDSVRCWVSNVAKFAEATIPIDFLSSHLSVYRRPLLLKDCASLRAFFDQIAEQEGLVWCITERGLWMAQQPPNTGEYIGSSGKLYRTKRSANQPFVWSEIHEILEMEVAELDSEIRKEIKKPQRPIPKHGAERNQFFLLLEERANHWADRALDVFEKCLTEIGRKDSLQARSSVYSNALSFFLNDKLRYFLYFECGCFVERPYPTRSPREPRRTFVATEIPHDVGQSISHIIERVKSRIKERFVPTIEDWQKTLARMIEETTGTKTPTETIRNRISKSVEGEPVAFGVSENQSSSSGSRTDSVSSRRGLLERYRSECKKAILIQLTKNPGATDRDICKSLDADGGVELPENWSKVGNRSFETAYLNHSQIKSRIEKMISKVRGDLQQEGLLSRRSL